jgi:murein L,D-transpeptidase YcbB/YkuD
VKALATALIAGIALTIAACHSPANPQEVTPALQTLVNGAPLPKVEAAVWSDLRTFYTQREHAPAWVNHRRPTEKAAEAIKVLNTARRHGFDPNDYGTAQLLEMSQAVEKLDKGSEARLEELAEFDARLTAAMFAFGKDVAIGREKADANFSARRTMPDLMAAVTAAVDDPEKFVDAVRPQHDDYVALTKALDDLHGQKEKGGWLKVPSAKSVEEMRQRLQASGHLKEGGDLAAAVKSFQELHALPATGVVDEKTLAALNVPLDRRMQQVAINLQRWRWMPDQLGDRHFFVNVPSFTLVARESGKPVMDIRVVVGKPGNNTPIFSEEMETVVFSPYWNIPDTIAENETAPAIARDPNYLSRQGIEILRVSNGTTQTLDPSDVQWGSTDSMRGLVFRQKPGAGNALGHVKFMFPNKHNVYLHDTPADSLFAKPGRAFSHGCVRVEEPEALAKYVLKDYPEWDLESIGAAMHSGNEKHVKLKAKIPVHIAYFTSWVDENGGVHFVPDIYRYDKDGGN